MDDDQHPARRMSDLLAEKIEAATSAAMQDAGGGIVTGAVTFVRYINAEGEPCWSLTTPIGQDPFTTFGLLHGATVVIDEQVSGWVR